MCRLNQVAVWIGVLLGTLVCTSATAQEPQIPDNMELVETIPVGEASQELIGSFADKGVVVDSGELHLYEEIEVEVDEPVPDNSEGVVQSMGASISLCLICWKDFCFPCFQMEF